MDSDLKDLLNGEKLIWSGKPKQGIVFRKNDIFVIPFSILWLLLCFLAISTILKTQVPNLLLLVVIPIALLGLFFLVGRYVLDVKRRNKIKYWLTDQRIVIKGEKLKNEFKSISTEDLKYVEYKPKKNGFGTIILGDDREKSFGRFIKIEELYWLNPKRSSRLELIENANNILDKIKSKI